MNCRHPNEPPPTSLTRRRDFVCRVCRSRTGVWAAIRVQSEQLCAERADGCSRAAADQQTDRVAAASGADAEQPGEESGHAAVLVVVAVGTVDPAYPAVARPGPAHRLRYPADRSCILDDLRAGIVKPFRPGADRERANALAERNSRPAGR